VVDDDEQIRLLLCLLLEQDGYSVHTAAGGEEALDEMMRGGLTRF
jgi:CheY-like chemotaxis protein